MSSFVLFAALAVGLADAAKFPKGWKNCKHDDNLNSCLKDAIQSVIPSLVQGVPSLGVHSIDPLHFEKLSIGRGRNHPVDLDLDFTDFYVLGLKDTQLQSFKTDWKTMLGDLKVPRLTVKGNYKVDGKVLILPVKGDGDCELECDNFIGHLNITFREKSVKTKTYYEMDDIRFSFDCDNLKLKFDNLFNGDKVLGDQMNVFLNENWKELLKELGPPIAQSLAMAFTEIGNRVFTKIPKDEITPP